MKTIKAYLSRYYSDPKAWERLLVPVIVALFSSQVWMLANSDDSGSTNTVLVVMTSFILMFPIGWAAYIGASRGIGLRVLGVLVATVGLHRVVYSLMSSGLKPEMAGSDFSQYLYVFLLVGLFVRSLAGKGVAQIAGLEKPTIEPPESNITELDLGATFAPGSLPTAAHDGGEVNGPLTPKKIERPGNVQHN